MPSLIHGFPSEHFENEVSDIMYNDQDSELDEVERWFSEMNEQVNHVTCWESHPKPLNEELRAPLRPFVEEPLMLELKPIPKI